MDIASIVATAAGIAIAISVHELLVIIYNN